MRVIMCVEDDARIADAARAVSKLTRGGGSEVYVLHVLHPGEGGSRPGDHEALAERRRAAIEERLAGVGLEATVLVETRGAFQHLSERILRTARRLEADMLVVVSKRSTRLAGFMLGSVAQDLLKQDAFPVLIVRPTA